MPPPMIATGASIKPDYRKCWGRFQGRSGDLGSWRLEGRRARLKTKELNVNWVRFVKNVLVGGTTVRGGQRDACRDHRSMAHSSEKGGSTSPRASRTWWARTAIRGPA